MCVVRVGTRQYGTRKLVYICIEIWFSKTIKLTIFGILRKNLNLFLSLSIANVGSVFFIYLLSWFDGIFLIAPKNLRWQKMCIHL